MGNLESRLAMMKAANAANNTNGEQPPNQQAAQTNIKQPHSKFESDAFFDRLGGITLATKDNDPFHSRVGVNPATGYESSKSLGTEESQYDKGLLPSMLNTGSYFGLQEDDGLNQMRYNNQPWLDLVGNASAKIVNEVVGGTVSALGGLAEIPSLVNSIFSEDAYVFDNALLRAGDAISKFGDETFKNYHQSSIRQGFEMDGAWWADNIASVASSLAMLFAGEGVFRAAGYASRSMRALAGLEKIMEGTATGAEAAANSSKILKGLSKGLDVATWPIRRTGNGMVDQIKMAVFMRNAENVMESHGVLNDTYDRAMEQLSTAEGWAKFTSSEDGKKIMKELSQRNAENGKQGVDRGDVALAIAKRSAYRSYYVNAGNLIFDVFQLRGLFRPFNAATKAGNFLTKEEQAMFKRAGKEVAGKVEKNASLKAINAQREAMGLRNLTRKEAIAFKAKAYAREYVLESGLEGVEEIVNTIGTNEGNHYGRYLLGDHTDGNAFERISEYLQDANTWESAFWGTAGGLVFSAATRGITKVRDGYDISKDRINEIGSRAITVAKFMSDYNSINKGIDPTTSKEFTVSPGENLDAIKKEAIQDLIASAGYKMGANAAKSKSVDWLMDWIGSENFNDIVNPKSDAADGSNAPSTPDPNVDPNNTTTPQTPTTNLQNSPSGVSQEDANYITQVLKDNIAKAAKDYHENHYILSRHVKDQNIREILVSRLMDSDRNIEHWNKYLSKEKGNLEKVISRLGVREGAAYKKFIEDGYNLDQVLDWHAKSMLVKEYENQLKRDDLTDYAREKTTAAIERLNKEMAEMDKTLPSNVSSANPANTGANTSNKDRAKHEVKLEELKKKRDLKQQERDVARKEAIDMTNEFTDIMDRFHKEGISAEEKALAKAELDKSDEQAKEHSKRRNALEHEQNKLEAQIKELEDIISKIDNSSQNTTPASTASFKEIVDRAIREGLIDRSMSMAAFKIATISDNIAVSKNTKTNILTKPKEAQANVQETLNTYRNYMFEDKRNQFREHIQKVLKDKPLDPNTATAADVKAKIDILRKIKKDIETNNNEWDINEAGRPEATKFTDSEKKLLMGEVDGYIKQLNTLGKAIVSTNQKNASKKASEDRAKKVQAILEAFEKMFVEGGYTIDPTINTEYGEDKKTSLEKRLINAVAGDKVKLDDDASIDEKFEQLQEFLENTGLIGLEMTPEEIAQRLLDAIARPKDPNNKANHRQETYDGIINFIKKFGQSIEDKNENANVANSDANLEVASNLTILINNLLNANVGATDIGNIEGASKSVISATSLSGEFLDEEKRKLLLEAGIDVDNPVISVDYNAAIRFFSIMHDIFNLQGDSENSYDFTFDKIMKHLIENVDENMLREFYPYLGNLYRLYAASYGRYANVTVSSYKEVLDFDLDAAFELNKKFYHDSWYAFANPIGTRNPTDTNVRSFITAFEQDSDNKVDSDGTIHLSSKSENLLQILNSMVPGSEVEARIKEVNGQKTVVLSIMGREIGQLNSLPYVIQGFKLEANGNDWYDNISMFELALDMETNSKEVLKMYQLLKLGNSITPEQDKQLSNILKSLDNSDSTLVKNLTSVMKQSGNFADNKSIEEGVNRDILTHILNVMLYDIDHRRGVSTVSSDNIKNNLISYATQMKLDIDNNKSIRESLEALNDPNAVVALSSNLSGGDFNIVLRDGKKVYRSLGETFNNPETLKLFRLVPDTNRGKISNVEDSSETVDSFGSGFAHTLYMEIEEFGRVRRAPVFFNTLDGTRRPIDKKYKALIQSYVYNQLEILHEAVKNNDTDGISKALSNIGNYYHIGNSNTPNMNQLSYNNGRLSLAFRDKNGLKKVVTWSMYGESNGKPTPNGLFSVKTYDANNKETEKTWYNKSEKVGKTNLDSFEAFFVDNLEASELSVDYSKLEKTDTIYRDHITGVEYANYKQYLIATDRIITDISPIIGKSGRKYTTNTKFGGNNSNVKYPLVLRVGQTGRAKVRKPAEIQLHESVKKITTALNINVDESVYGFLFKELSDIVSEGSATLGVGLDNTEDYYGLVSQVTNNKQLNARKGEAKAALSFNIRFSKKMLQESNLGAQMQVAHEMAHFFIKSRLGKDYGKITNELKTFRKDLLNTVQYKDLKAGKYTIAEGNKDGIFTQNEVDIITVILEQLSNPNSTPQNIEEIVAYGFGNMAFAKFLNFVPATEGFTPTERAGKPTFFTKLKNIMLKLIGQFIDGPTKLDELNELLDLALEGNIDMVRSGNKTTRSVKPVPKTFEKTEGDGTPPVVETTPTEVTVQEEETIIINETTVTEIVEQADRAGLEEDDEDFDIPDSIMNESVLPAISKEIKKRAEIQVKPLTITSTGVINANTVVSELVDSEITDEEVDELIKFCS